jgi:chromate transporter
VSTVTTVPFREALRFWIKLGFISFGGPAGQIAIMHREVVERRRWLSEERFLHALNYCMLLPGPEAQQLATYIGWRMHRTLGGVVAGGFFVLPSIFVLMVLSYVYAAYGHVAAIVGILSGFKPVVVAIVVEAVARIARRALKGPAHVAIATAAFIGIYLLHVPFPLIVLLAGGSGLLGARLWPAAVMPSAPPNHSLPVYDQTPIDDRAPVAPHTVPSRRRVVRIAALWLVLWLVPYVLIVAWCGWNDLHAQLYRFFTGAAFVTFGGAYAVLAYVMQAAVVSFGWISSAQAVDGLALAETTPGPLIMVLQFVGFVAGWVHPHTMSPLASAVLGGLVATYTTFLPCFFFIFLGAPYVEVLRGHRSLSAALSGITAAVVGVILNLALAFGTAVVWPNGLAGETSWFALVLAVGAFTILSRFKVDVLWVVIAAGAMGLVSAISIRG